VINTSRSERGWRGRRRIAVLVSVVGIMGLIAMGAASSASAGFTQCGGSVKVKKGNSTVSFTCSTDVRAYGIASNKTVKSFQDVPSVNGAASSFLVCTSQTQANGFGCGVPNRAIATDGSGTQAQANTGATTSCGRSTTTQAAGPGGNPPAINGVTGPTCAQVIPIGQTVTQQVAFKGNPCNTATKNPFEVFVIVGAEPIVSTFTVRGDSNAVGEALSDPQRLKIKGCTSGGGKSKKSSASSASAVAHSSSGTAVDPQSSLNCLGTVSPKQAGKPSADLVYALTCNQNVRLYSIVTNRQSDFFGSEGIVTGPGVNSTPCVNPPAPAPPLSPPQCAAAESAAIQCEGAVPGFGAGCSFPDRQGNLSNVLTYGRRLSGGNTITGDLGMVKSPCIRAQGEPKIRVWAVALTEPFIPSTGATGEFVSPPFPMAVSGYGSKACAKVLNKNKKK
jgi:hypothetical protein